MVKALARQERGLSVAYGVAAGICAVLLWQLFHAPPGKPNGG